MKRLVAVVVMSLLAVLGFTGTASANEELTPEQQAQFDKCEAEFFDALDAHVADFDQVQFDQFVYDWEDLWTKYDKGLISDEELIAGLDEITDGLFSEFLECLGTDEPVEPDDKPADKPAVVPTSVPAGLHEPDTGAGITAALVGLGLVAAAGVTLLARRTSRLLSS